MDTCFYFRRLIILSIVFLAAHNLLAVPISKSSNNPSPRTATSSYQSKKDPPKDSDIFRSQGFEEPLVPVGKQTTLAENLALGSAIEEYKKRTDQDDHSAILRFLIDFPNSPWRPALLTNLGLRYRRTGWFLKALAAWREAWALSKKDKSRLGKALADRAVGELAELTARLGRSEEAEAILKDISDRPLIGPATEKVTAAREGVWMMHHEPENAFKCGPFALARIQASTKPGLCPNPKILETPSSDHGMSLDQVCNLSRELGMKFQMARRVPGSKVLIPSVVHWKAKHYAALLKESQDQYLIEDPTFGGAIWGTKAALDNEASGYYLVPNGPLPSGWEAIGEKEAKTIWGMGNTGDHDPTGTKCFDDKAKCDTSPSCGMARYNFHTQVVSLNVTDTPIGYKPPRGPDAHFTLTYNQRELASSSNAVLPNFGSKWVCNWVAFLDDVSWSPDPITVHIPDGGTEFFYFYWGATTAFQSGAILTRDLNPPPPTPPHYERTMRDGSQQVFDLHSGNIGDRRFYMTKLIDPTGQALNFNYDPVSFRLISVTDAVGQSFTISYLSDDPAILPDYYLISRVEDFAHRAATFEYENGQLWKIHDAIGITSEFHYEPGGDFMTSMTTPYGTTTFSQPPSSLDVPDQPGNARTIQAVEPDGGIERLEYGHNAPGIDPVEPLPPDIYILNGLYNYRNSFYWDKQAMAMYPPDENGVPQFTKAKIIHWLHVNDGTGNLVSNIKEREKMPLENAVYYFYPGQQGVYGPVFTGTSGSPSSVCRRLDNGMGQAVTQFYRYEYNSIHNVTQFTDPSGRVTSYQYAPNNVDVLNVYQRNPQGVSVDPGGMAADKIFSYIYNSRHEPLTVTDAAGQATTYTYNPDGQVSSIQNAKGEMTTYKYGDGVTAALGYLTSITSPPFNGTSAVVSFGYDNAGHIQTVTDSDGYTTIREYDNLDRLTRVTYPDTTSEQFQYTDNTSGAMTLDLTASRDRRGRWTYWHYDSNRRMDSMTDPLGRTTLYSWCSCGSLQGITDPAGHATTFKRDLEGRIYQKISADNTAISYFYEGQTGPDTVGTTSRLQSMTDALNQTTNYQYSIDDNLQEITYSNAVHITPSVSYTYDPNYNRMVSMTDGSGVTMYSFYPVAASPTLGANRLADVDGPLSSDTITFKYDELGRIKGRSINGNSNPETWAFDSLGRVSSDTNKLGTFIYSYVNVTDRLNAVTYPGGHSVSYTYFPNAQDRHLQQIKNQTSAGVLLSQFDYTYNSEGELITWTKSYPGLPAPQRHVFGYDNADQLLSAPLRDVPTNALVKQYGYTYDVAGNRTAERVGNKTTNSVPNNVNEIVSQNGAVNRTLSYDANGHLINDGSVRTFEWDAANRLVAINYTGTANRSEFSYDGLNRCIKIVEKSNEVTISTRKFVWCGSERCEFRGANNAVTLLVFPQGQYSGGVPFFYMRDHLGSVREMINSGGTVLTRYDYDPYGRVTTVIGTTRPDFNFTGFYQHGKSNLCLAIYRAYDAELGRWISRDPVEENGGLNLYAYVGNSPNNRTDPFGLLDFRYHGKWGGPGWANGGWNSESGSLPSTSDPNYVPPIDAEDACYEQHDRCVHDCPLCPKSASSECIERCDLNLHFCLNNLEYKTLRTRFTSWAFAGLIPWLVH